MNPSSSSASHADLTRRNFLKVASAGTAALGAGLWPAAANSPNDRINIGVLGTGVRGIQLIREILPHAGKHNVAVTAVCDVWSKNLDAAVTHVHQQSGQTPIRTTRYQELLAMKDLDAIVIATPDFAHATMLIDSLQANKDVYIEKPMTLDIPSANRALDLARAKNRVVQVGTQRRSEGRYLAAAKVVQSGVLGQISRVHSAVNFNQARWARDFADCKAEDVDWPAFLMHLPARPFDARALRRWYLYREFTNGVPGLWMTHFTDNMNFVTGAKYPSRAVALGGTYVWKDGREHTDTFQALLEYPEGFLFDWGLGLANAAGGRFSIHGTKGTFDVEARTLSPAGGHDTTIEARTIPDEPGLSHMQNWFECMKSRQRPHADIECGHQHTVATVMAATAFETGRRQVYDPVKRTLSAG
jgi:predicted dehydrogenase